MTEHAAAAAPHHLRRMTGRDPHEKNRVASPLELLFDLTLVVAFGAAGSQLAHLIAEGHLLPGIVGFCAAIFAISWPWINYSWFSSAFDTDDWYVRGATLIQMIGVVILTIGLPEFFHGLDEGFEIHNGTLVGGYVVMRLGMLMLWARAARESDQYAKTCRLYVVGIAAAQVIWILIAVFHLPSAVALPLMGVMFVFEMAVPWYAESRGDTPTPWHAHHIAERYSLLVIISLGEIVVRCRRRRDDAVHRLDLGLDGRRWRW
ncbi:low temperature requirement protein A [Dermacoccaceae bacterium W4C1]